MGLRALEKILEVIRERTFGFVLLSALTAPSASEKQDGVSGLLRMFFILLSEPGHRMHKTAHAILGSFIRSNSGKQVAEKGEDQLESRVARKIEQARHKTFFNAYRLFSNGETLFQKLPNKAQRGLLQQIGGEIPLDFQQGPQDGNRTESILEDAITACNRDELVSLTKHSKSTFVTNSIVLAQFFLQAYCKENGQLEAMKQGIVKVLDQPECARIVEKLSLPGGTASSQSAEEARRQRLQWRDQFSKLLISLLKSSRDGDRNTVTLVYKMLDLAKEHDLFICGRVPKSEASMELEKRMKKVVKRVHKEQYACVEQLLQILYCGTDLQRAVEFLEGQSGGTTESSHEEGLSHIEERLASLLDCFTLDGSGLSEKGDGEPRTKKAKKALPQTVEIHWRELAQLLPQYYVEFSGAAKECVLLCWRGILSELQFRELERPVPEMMDVDEVDDEAADAAVAGAEDEGVSTDGEQDDHDYVLVGDDQGDNATAILVGLAGCLTASQEDMEDILRQQEEDADKL